jgi:predicted MFS family arabinose efflux permease
MPERRWLILAVLFVARTCMGFQFQTVASTAPGLMAELHVGYATIGSLIGVYMLPGLLLAFPSGLLSRRFGDKPVAVAGLALMLAGGLLLAVAATPPELFAGRLVSGAGAVLFNLMMTKMATDWFAGREIVLAMGVLVSSWPAGIASGLQLQPLLAAASGWRAVMVLAAGLSGLSLLLILLGYRAPPRGDPKPGTAALPVLPPAAQLLPTIVAGVMWGNINLALVLYFSFAPPELVRLGLAPTAAAGWAGAAVWVIMLSPPLGGGLAQRSGHPDAVSAFSALVGAAALALLPAGITPLAMGLLFGVFMGPVVSAITALPSRVLSPSHRAGGLGVFMTLYYLAVTVGPGIGGVLREQWGTPAAALFLAAGLMLSLAPLQGLFILLARRLH